MESIQSNIAELRKILNEDNFKKDEADEFLDAIEEGVNDLDEELKEVKDELEKEQEKVSDLEKSVSELEDSAGNDKIDCGIGDIEFITPDNLQLIDLMENLNGAIQKIGSKKVNELLSAVS